MEGFDESPKPRPQLRSAVSWQEETVPGEGSTQDRLDTTFGSIDSEAPSPSSRAAPRSRAGDASNRSRANSSATSGMLDSSILSQEGMDGLYRQSVEWLSCVQDRGGAKWTSRCSKSALQQGEEMLEEQAALDDRSRLVRSVRICQGQTKELPLRTHITQNIRLRLQEEAQRDTVETLAMNQQCQNIRKHLVSMQNSRRDLASLRTRVQAITGDIDDVTSEFGGLTGFRAAKRKEQQQKQQEQQGAEGRSASSSPEPAVRRRLVGSTGLGPKKKKNPLLKNLGKVVDTPMIGE